MAVLKSQPKKVKKKVRRTVPHGRVYIQSTYNNTIISFTDEQGNVLAWSSAGSNSFKGPKKATPYAASMVIRTLYEKIKDMGVKQVDVFVKGVGSGRESAIRSLTQHGINILSIKDLTPTPHNGTRQPRPRRV
ncbi:MAG: 30S ribosomal protein S11 [Candidatus Kerfeldbacteria bacterium CG08_land_8_20_14_0_20_42_7]|uniref:Small ribosomal subunit protein uS11 n=1 Tax=Candidatus Kerfeldbacteria bacterium CG08_land_8_20_14_0_20_42_7 TaxID=2014245 RepID=A0A2H0YUW8_9BACT|nr:MAG: 30S ribosomal protein S11 [Candidatus Kerfeldbacteria bacterium CG08_land_8_20_14_0_20_42_7]